MMAATVSASPQPLRAVGDGSLEGLWALLLDPNEGRLIWRHHRLEAVTDVGRRGGWAITLLFETGARIGSVAA